MPPQKMPDDDEIPSAEEKGDDRVPPRDIPDDDIIPSDDQEGIERIPTHYEITYSEICLFLETEDILLFNKKNYKD